MWNDSSCHHSVVTVMAIPVGYDINLFLTYTAIQTEQQAFLLTNLE